LTKPPGLWSAKRDQAAGWKWAKYHSFGDFHFTKYPLKPSVKKLKTLSILSECLYTYNHPPFVSLITVYPGKNDV
jgi:hypothetical protein